LYYLLLGNFQILLTGHYIYKSLDTV